ncbi:uncharacterized protein LOC111729582 [Pteropus vampyrus]|uniref:Uncharacterized protein LOC111729582 n=1 Tax=Pteropus vampyrus TaxID=132908 RepID=A0A6P6BMK9_PTEVA|nr:uncharacterized protein LOC111729582 [Pteropus vampyrus]
MMMKKKKKKPKQKRYSQPRAGGPWGDDSAKDPKGRPFAADPQKPDVLPSPSTAVGTEYGPASGEDLRKDRDIDSKTAKPVAESCVAESLGVPSCPLEEPIKSQPTLRVEAEVKGSKAGPQSRDGKSLQQGEGTPEDQMQTLGSLGLQAPPTEVSAHKGEIPSEGRPREGCSPVLDQEAVGTISKPTAAKELPNSIPTLTACSPLGRSLTEGKDARKVTDLQNDRQKESSEGAEQVKELHKEALPQQRQGTSVLASEQPQDGAVVQVPGPGSEPFKRMAGDGKSRKGRGSSGKARAGSGKGRARAETPFLPHGQEDGGAVLVPSEPDPQTERTPAVEKREEHPGIMADPPESGVMGKPKETADPSRAGTLQASVPLGNGAGMTQTSGARTDGGAIATHPGVGNQGKAEKCPWMDREAAPWFSERPKKRNNEGKTKKFKNSYSAHPARMESKEELLSPAFVEKGEAGSTALQNEEPGLTFPMDHEPLSSHTSDASTAEAVDRKGGNVEVNSFELGVLGGNKTHTVKDSAVTEAATKVTDVSRQDLTQGAGFVPAVLPEEHKTAAAEGHAAAADKPNKRNNGEKSKKAKNSFPEKHILENETDATKAHVPIEATGVHSIEGMGFVDENRNITFTCPRIQPGVINKTVPVEALDSAACEKLPTPAFQVVKEGDSFPDTLAESRQETAPAHTSELLAVDNGSKVGVPDRESPKAPSAVTPSAGPGGGALPSTACAETRRGPGDKGLENEGELADPMISEAGTGGGGVTGASESVPSGASEHSTEEVTELAKGRFSGVPADGQSRPGDVRGLEACADRSNFPTYPVNKKKEREKGSAPVQIPDVLGDKAQGPHSREDQNAEGREARGPPSLNKEVDVTPLPPESEKCTLEVISLASKVTELEDVSVPTPELQSDFSDGRVEASPPRLMDTLALNACKELQPPGPQDRISEAHGKMMEEPEPEALAEGKKEDKSRTAEPVKGYMRPTKSRGLPPSLPKSTVQERERPKPAKASGMALPWAVCVRVAFDSASERQRACALVPSRL